MAKALKIGASVLAIAAVTVVTGGAALGLGVALTTSAFGVSAGALLAASSVLGAGASLLAPKPKAPAGLSQSDRLNVSINTREPRKIVFGTTAMATDLRDQEWSSDQTYLHRFIVVASHRINAVREIWFDDKLAWTAAGGAQGEFARWLQVTPVLEGSAANAINIGPRMGGSRRFTGCAYVHLRYQILANSKKLDSVFNQSVPSRVTIVGDGAPVYDPRRDSTVPGGSGPQRANDQSTWEWSASASRNPALCTLFYLLGWRINGKLAVGKGIPPRRIDLASFIEAANLCDEPVAKAAGGTEPRYRCDGVISEADDTQAVLDNLKATMNAVLDDVDGRLRVSVLHNDLAAPIGDLFTGDVLGAFTWQQTLPLNDSVSVIRGGYSDPGPVSLYQTADYPEVTIASRDGIERSQTVNYPLVQSASQAQRLSKQRLQRMLYGGTFTAVFQSTAWKFQKGDVIRLTFAPLGWDRKLFRIADMATQVDGKVPMMLREEHPAIYAWDASDAAPVTGAEPTRYDPALWPLVQGIAEAGTTADWDKVADPSNTKPQDNATVGAPSGTNIGGRPVDDVLTAFDRAQAQQNHFETVVIPAVDDAVADAKRRIADAELALKTGSDERVKLASRATLLEADSRAMPQYLNKQATFSNWPDGSGDIPGGWGLASASPGAQAGRVDGLIGRYALETYWPGGAGSLFYAVSALNFGDMGGGIDPGMFVNSGWFVVEVDVTLTEGTLFGAGCYVAAYTSNGINLATRQWHFPDNADATGGAPGGGTPGKRYRFSFMTEMSDPRVASLRFHPMTAWQGFQDEPATKRLKWNLAGVRQASAEEIANHKARTVDLPAAVARIRTTEDTLADLPNRYAVAQRTIDLEAQLNGDAGSRLLSRASEQATVIADDKAGLVATSVERLRTDFDGRIGQVEQKAGAITDIDGRTSVYWQVTGTTNDGATMIQLTKKDGSSPLFYIGANTLIDGNLMVTGTVNSRVIQNGAVTNSLTTTGGTYGFQQNTVQETGTLTMSIAGTGYVRIDVRLSTNYVDGESGSTAPNQWFLALYCEQNGSQRLVGSTPFREGPYVSFWDNDVPSAGTARYFVRITLSVAQRNGTVFNTKINATEYKK